MGPAERIEALVARWLRVPAEPEPPPGTPGTVRVFRAAPGYFHYTLIVWIIGQVGTLAGLLFGFLLGWNALDDVFGSRLPEAVVLLIEVGAWTGFLGQLVLSFGTLRLSFENRWYMLSDRALRIREGIVRVREQTMTFANIQNISVRQGPLQRLLGIADVEVRTAGGGSSGEAEGPGMHRGWFRGVADAERVRDTIRQRVDAYRASPAGPSADAVADRSTASDGVRLPPSGVHPSAVAAAREVLEEVRSLRGVLAPHGRGAGQAHGKGVGPTPPG